MSACQDYLSPAMSTVNECFFEQARRTLVLYLFPSCLREGTPKALVAGPGLGRGVGRGNVGRAVLSGARWVG